MSLIYLYRYANLEIYREIDFAFQSSGPILELASQFSIDPAQTPYLRDYERGHD